MDDALQVTRRLVEEVATSIDGSEGFELSFHDIEKAYPRVCRGVLCDLLSRWGCDQSLLRVIQKLHGGTSYKVRVHGGMSSFFVLERGLREGCPSSPVLFNIYHAAVMMDFRARRKEAASRGQMDEGLDWVAQVDGGLFRPRSSRKRGRCQLRTVLGDVEFADDTVTCSAASFAPAVEQLFDETLNDWSQRRNVGKTERLLVVPNAPRVQVGVAEPSCAEARPRVKVVRHVGGLLSADGRHDHDTSYSRARRMVGMIARSWSRGQKDKRGRSSPLSLPLRLRLMKAHVDPILSTFCRSRSWTKAQLRSLKCAQAYSLRRAFGVDRFSMQEEHISDKMFQAADWEPIDSIIQWACWTWLGHVARMHIPALPKLALWGWPSTSKAGSKRRLQGSWLKAVLAKTSLSARDWFRIAVLGEVNGRQLVGDFFPRRSCRRNILFDLGLGRRVLPFQFLHPNAADVLMRCLQHLQAPLLARLQGRFGVGCSLRRPLQFFPRNSRQSFGDKAFFSMFSLRSRFSVEMAS